MSMTILMPSFTAVMLIQRYMRCSVSSSSPAVNQRETMISSEAVLIWWCLRNVDEWISWFGEIHSVRTFWLQSWNCFSVLSKVCRFKPRTPCVCCSDFTGDMAIRNMESLSRSKKRTFFSCRCHFWTSLLHYVRPNWFSMNEQRKKHDFLSRLWNNYNVNVITICDMHYKSILCNYAMIINHKLSSC